MPRSPSGASRGRPIVAEPVTDAALGCGCLAAAGEWQPNLTWITPDLAVGGRVPAERVAHLAETGGIGAVVDLRSEDRDDSDHLEAHGIRFLHLPTDDHGALRPTDIDAGAAFAARAARDGRRLLVHCEHGIGRSATLALCILVERGMEPLAALRLAKDRRDLVSPSPAQYECWVAWLKRHPGSGPDGWALPGFEAFKTIAYRHLLAR
ncbi:dual specificity protein phosphatase family protein [uncultured Enterovirga sp.]|uniref:protein-tyrosine phosphatase family protein n=1 Tax=uncultured Enterovirga sp. TaxID=2026352 RepID=UPI0035CC6606